MDSYLSPTVACIDVRSIDRAIRLMLCLAGLGALVCQKPVELGTLLACRLNYLGGR
jgi:hypothetical protein